MKTRTQPSKKGCCLFAILKWILILCGLLFILAVVSVFINDTPNAVDTNVQVVTAAPATQVSTATPEADPTATPDARPAATTEKLAVPGIDGSNAYDPIIDLESKGIAKPKTITTDDGLFEWTSDSVWIDSTLVSYQIHANEKHEILDATFTMAGQDNGFLIYAASLPYSSAEKEKASQFVKDHMAGESASVIIGDAIFSIYPNERGAMLEIKDIDSDAFYSELLNIKLGL